MAQASDFRVAMVRRTFREAVELAEEARNYLSFLDRRGPGVSTLDSMKLTCESLRVTARLTQVLAWSMVWRAVEAGEITADEARAEHNRLAGEEVCLDVESAQGAKLPDALRKLLDRSFDLYVRVMRLEQLDGLREDHPGLAPQTVRLPLGGAGVVSALP